MSEEQAATGLIAIWSEVGENIQVLGVAGLCGAFIKALLAPEKLWKRRAVQAIVGLFAAIFLGGFIGSLVEPFVTVAAYAYLAAGFVCGTAGEVAISFAQRKMLSDEKPSSRGRSPSRPREDSYPDYEGEDVPSRRPSRSDRPTSTPTRRR